MPNLLRLNTIRRRKGGRGNTQAKNRWARKPYCLFSHVPHAESYIHLCLALYLLYYLYILSLTTRFGTIQHSKCDMPNVNQLLYNVALHALFPQAHDMHIPHLSHGADSSLHPQAGQRVHSKEKIRRFVNNIMMMTKYCNNNTRRILCG